MMKRLAAAGIVTTALGGVLFTASPAMANDDELEVNQEKVAEVNLICNLLIAAVQKDDPQCGGTEAEIEDDDEANHVKIKHSEQHHGGGHH